MMEDSRYRFRLPATTLDPAWQVRMLDDIGAQYPPNSSSSLFGILVTHESLVESI